MKEKGTRENPYSFDEYLELAKKKTWKGGYVDMGGGCIVEVPTADEWDDDEDYGSGSGSGSGTNDKPLYMVRAGSDKIQINTIHFGMVEVTISWRNGIAKAASSGGYSNRDGFVAGISTEVSVASQYEKDKEKSKDDTSWSAPYTIKLDIHNVYTDRTVAPRREDRPDEKLDISDFEYIIPSIYHEEFSL